MALTVRPSVLRWGICTAGAIAHDFVSSLVGHEDEHRVVAVAARSLDRARTFADELAIPTAYGSYEELAEDSNIDIIYIGSIHTEHVNHCKLFLGHKKHVLCEKPSALTLRGTNEIISLAKQNGVFFMEGLWTAFFPVCQKIRDVLSSGQLGDVVTVIGNHGQAISHRERISRRDFGGGGLYDLGCYLFYVVAMVFGKDPISSHSHGFLNTDGVDETFTTTMLYPGGALATLTVSCRADYPNDVTIVGTKGRLRIPSHFWTPTSLEWTNEEGVTSFTECSLPITEASFHHGPEWAAMYYEADAARDAITKGLTEHPVMSWRMTGLIARLMEQTRVDLGVKWKEEDKS